MQQRNYKFYNESLSMMQTQRLASTFVTVMLCSLIFFQAQFFGEGFNFCFDGSKEGYRLSSKVIRYAYATTGEECVFLCIQHGKPCRSVNFRNTPNIDTNCEFLADVDSERPELLLKDKKYDYYIYLGSNWRPSEAGSTCSASKIIQSSSAACSDADWLVSFDRLGWSLCDNDKLFITGFYRSRPYRHRDPIFLLERAKCCGSILEYVGQNETCKIADWSDTLNRDNMWSSCPLGYFLNGFYRNDGKKLQNIKKGNCCKPSNHPESYGMCYDEDVRTKFERKGWTYCSKRSYYITGIYRGSGNKLKNIDLFRCCQMASDEKKVREMMMHC